MAGIDHPTLDEHDRTDLNAPISFSDLKEALIDLNHDSSPGIDGLSPLFFLHFWDHLKNPLYECFMESIKNKSLSLSQRRAILSLLPKSAE